MSEWQPIETAPKDGTVVDLWNIKGHRLTDIRWVVEPRDGVAHPNCIMDGWKRPSYVPWECLTPDQFTHWMPLPQPPTLPLHGEDEG